MVRLGVRPPRVTRNTGGRTGQRGTLQMVCLGREPAGTSPSPSAGGAAAGSKDPPKDACALTPKPGNGTLWEQDHHRCEDVKGPR